VQVPDYTNDVLGVTYDEFVQRFGDSKPSADSMPDLSDLDTAELHDRGVQLVAKVKAAHPDLFDETSDGSSVVDIS